MWLRNHSPTINTEFESIVTMTKKIAITGGIGSGKSVVARILNAMGYECFDCDLEAKLIMDSSQEIMRLLTSDIHPKAVENGRINRKIISETVFADADKLNRLNAIVHGAVKDEIKRRVAMSTSNPYFIETAILYESGIDRMVDEVWVVDADTDTRIERVMSRNALSREEVMARINSQNLTHDRVHPIVKVIHNNDSDALLPQIHALLNNC